MRKERYLKKLEVFEEEMGFMEMHSICDAVTERALLHSLQVCVEVSLDIVSMLVKDLGMVVEDDYTNIEKLAKEGIIRTEEMKTLKEYNGLRNSIAHRYNNLDVGLVETALEGIDKLYNIIEKLVQVYEKIESKNV
ncbi:MAG: DUF86 domain-containing protein [Candidatus Methanoperedens sp.]|nr:DUF86 domain-containing protein [Candidatus Methanoperedens sp.]